VVAALIDATRDKVADVRREAAYALDTIRPGTKAKGAGPRLIEMMEHGEGDFSASLEQVTIAPELVDRVLGLLPKYPEGRLDFVLATAGAAGVPKLIAALSSDSLAIQRGAAQALGLLGAKAKPAVPALIKSLGQPSLYGYAARGLGGIGPEAKEAIPALMACLGHDPWSQEILSGKYMHEILSGKRMHVSPAASALGCIGSPAVPELLRGLESNSDLVQAGSVQALARAGMDARDKVVPAVLAMVKHTRHPVLKGLAIETLLHLPADKEDLLSLLETLAKDPDPRVVQWAQEAKVQWTNNQLYR
jgi:HEAT repeat protein